MSSGFRRDADEICTLLGYNTAASGNPLPMFRDNISAPSSRVKKSKKSRKPMQETWGLCRQRHGREQPMVMHLCGRGKGSQTKVVVRKVKQPLVVK
jgi:hypothetical protein